MPQYIMLVNFTDQGLRGVKDVPNRQDKSRDTAKKFGVERKTVWMTFGPYDFVHLYEAPNDEAMAKFVMTLASFGNLRTTVHDPGQPQKPDLLDHLVGAREHAIRHREAESLGGLEVDHELIFGRRLHRQVGLSPL